jgi:4-hydroxy-2-oxoheptanedioate aldolase
MRENTVKTIWANGGCVMNGWLHIPSMWSAELMAHTGFDSLTIDMQHGMMSLETTVEMMQAISTTSTIPMARVTWNEPGLIMRLLDGGAYGIICPMVNTREQCEAFIGACRYHPQGYRSIGPTRVRIYAGADYIEHANDTVLTIAMIETQEAVDNVEAIASTPGLDGFYVGPSDLGMSIFGKGASDSEEPAFLEVLDKIVAAAKKNGITCGIHTGSSGYARKMMERGFQLVTVQSDGSFLQSAAKDIVAGLRGGDTAAGGKKDVY